MIRAMLWKRLRTVIPVVLCLSATPARSDEAAIAVAANFVPVMNQLVSQFEKSSGHKLVLSAGATGKLYAQIKNGAPFDILLSADDETPQRLEQEQFTVENTRFTYAVGRLVLWSSRRELIDARGDILMSDRFTRLAIANSRTAPYGAAAESVLRRMNAWERVSPKLVWGENIAQTFHFVQSGNAELGFVTLAQVRALPAGTMGSQWLVPPHLHDPLRQDAVLLKHGADNKAARAFLTFLRSADAKKIIKDLGYDFP